MLNFLVLIKNPASAIIPRHIMTFLENTFDPPSIKFGIKHHPQFDIFSKSDLVRFTIKISAIKLLILQKISKSCKNKTLD